MSVLPVSVRLALWASAAFAGTVPLARAVQAAHPDVDAVEGDLSRLDVWHALGERVMLVALPRSGDLTGMPRGSPRLAAAAVAAGECVFVPGIGGALVPTVSVFGPPGDRGLAVSWAAYDAEPVPTHRVEALSLGEVDLQLRSTVHELTEELAGLDVLPWAGSTSRSRVDARLADGQWGLPSGLPPRAAQVLASAARLSAAADVALGESSPALLAASDARRNLALRRLRSAADEALAATANVAVLHLAGLRP